MAKQTKSILDKATIVRSKRKNIKLTVTSRGELIVTAPIRYSIANIEKLVEQKEDWIKNKIEYASKNIEKNHYLLSYENVLVCGEVYKLQPAEVKKVCFNNKTMYYPTSKEDKKIKLIKSAYKKLALSIMSKRIDELSQKYKINYNTLSIMDSKTRWGSCDTKGNIKLNLRLVMLSPQIIDFVISHELVHRVEFNHSNKFYDVLEKLIPNWKVLRKELKSYSFLLGLYRDNGGVVK